MTRPRCPACLFAAEMARIAAKGSLDCSAVWCSAYAHALAAQYPLPLCTIHEDVVRDEMGGRVRERVRRAS